MLKKFNISDDTMVVTSKYITEMKLPILEVSHQDTSGGTDTWQFHCGNGDFSMQQMQLVRLDTILNIDSSVIDIADLKVGFSAKRETKDSLWKLSIDSK